MELLTIAAILIGPLAAVLTTLWLERRREIYARRMEIFRTLMRTRRLPMSVEHVGALNLVEIEFSKNKEVIDAWRTLLEHFSTEHVRRQEERVESSSTPQEQRSRNERFYKRLADERQRLLAKLLHAIARVMNFKVEQLEIFEGGYTPQGWHDDDQEMRAARRFLLDLYLGRAALPVVVFQHPDASVNGDSASDKELENTSSV